MSTGSLRRMGLLFTAVFLAVTATVFSIHVMDTSAAGLGGTCAVDSDCNADSCSTAGSCTCTSVPGAGTADSRVCTPSSSASSDAATASGEATTEAGSTATSDTGAGPGICGDTFAGYICQATTVVLTFSAQLLGAIVLMLINILIAFAKYNSFNNAAVVQLGWPVVRDVVNMFYIIILLISAFATIVGYPDEFHYKKVLPKLLLSAVLINFSRTLVQLMVDFSQVVMLTFVNAFVQAGAGNFVSALGLDTIMQLAQSNTNVTNDLGLSEASIIIAYMLANFLLAIMIGVVLIMTAFLIVRIVVIWLSLVLSPIAFFSSALPSTAKKALGAFTSDYWDRLTNALIGGPVMAFFLWLTLAVVQQTNSGNGGMTAAMNFNLPDSGLAIAATQIADAPHISSFIIGITLMLAGLNFAVSLSGKLGVSALKGFAESVSGRAQNAGRFFAALPFTAPAAAVRGAARQADRSFQLTQRASTRFAQSGIGQALATNRFTGAAVRERLRAGMTSQQKEAGKVGAEINGFRKDLMNNLKPEERDAYVASVLSSKPSTPEQKKAYQDFSDFVRSDEYRKAYEARNEKAYISKLPDTMSEDDKKNASKVLVQRDAQSQERAAYQRDVSYSEQLGDYSRVEKLKEELKKRPYLASEGEAEQKAFTDIGKDADKWKELGKDVAGDGRLITEIMKNNGYKFNNDGTYDPAMVDHAVFNTALESARKSNPELYRNMKAQAELMARSPGIKEGDLKLLQHRFNSSDGTTQSFKVTGVDDKRTATRQRNFAQQKAYDMIMSSGQGRAKGDGVDGVNLIEFMDNGGKYSEAMSVLNDAQDGKATESVAGTIQAELSEVSSKLNDVATKNEGLVQFSGLAGNVLAQMGEKGVTGGQRMRMIATVEPVLFEKLIDNFDALGDNGQDAVETIINQVTRMSVEIGSKENPTADEKRVKVLNEKLSELVNTPNRKLSGYVRNISRKAKESIRPIE